TTRRLRSRQTRPGMDSGLRGPWISPEVVTGRRNHSPLTYSRLFQNPVLKQITRELDAHRLEPADEGGLVAGGVVFAVGVAGLDAELAEAKAGPDDIMLGAAFDDFGDAHDLARPALKRGQRDPSRDGTADVLADDVNGQLEASQLHHDLHARQGVAGVVGVDR